MGEMSGKWGTRRAAAERQERPERVLEGWGVEKEGVEGEEVKTSAVSSKSLLRYYWWVSSFESRLWWLLGF
jgi:hypothetical protein